LYRVNGQPDPQPDPNTGDVEYFYDNAANGRGRPWITRTWGANPFKTTVGSYDPVGRVTQLDRLFGKGQDDWLPAYGIAASYDLAGNLTLQTYPSNHTVSYGYDIAARLASFTGNLGDGASKTYSTGISYSPFGMQQEQFGMQTPIYHKLHYNVRGQLYDVRASTLSLTQNEFDWNRGCLAFYYGGAAWGQSSTTNNGNITAQQHWAPPDDAHNNYSYTQQNYTYDSLNRLSSMNETLNGAANPSLTQSYGYDRFGNRNISSASGSGVNNQQTWIDPSNNRLYALSDQNVSDPEERLIRYDAAGNQKADYYSPNWQGTRSYDAENRMKAATDTNQTSTYVYDGDGNRIKRIVNTMETWQVYGIGGELIAEYAKEAPPSTPQKEYGYRSGELLITAEPGSGGGSTSSTLGNDLVSHWHLDEASGTRADSVGTNNLTDNNTVTQAAGKIGTAAQFTRANSEYLSAPNNQSLTMGDISFTLACWVYLDSNTNQMGIIGKSYSSDYFIHHDIGYAPYGLRFNVRMAADNVIHEVGAPTLSTGTWHLVVAWHDATANTINLQVDNGTVYTASVPDGGTRTDIGDPFEIGRRTYGEMCLDGRIDEASLWKRGLTTQERSDLWNGGAGSESTSLGSGTTGTQGSVHWLVTDRLGTPRMVFDQSGLSTGVSRHDYLPFGEDVPGNFRSGIPGYATGDGVRQRFTGYEMDGETGLNFAQARYQSPVQGRFTSVDPLGASANVINPQSFNRYSYVNNNPTNFIDPTGMMLSDIGVSQTADPFQAQQLEHSALREFQLTANEQWAAAHGGSAVYEGNHASFMPDSSGEAMSAGVVATVNIYGRFEDANGNPSLFAMAAALYSYARVKHFFGSLGGVFDNSGLSDGNRMFTIMGMAATASRYYYVNEAETAWRGLDGVMHPVTGYHPNGATGRRALAFEKAGAFRTAGRVVGVISIGISSYQAYSAFAEGDNSSGAKYSVDAVMGGVSFAGPYGAAAAGVYFGVDMTIGWPRVGRGLTQCDSYCQSWAAYTMANK
jgi:RHS repeat-associated protein